MDGVQADHQLLIDVRRFQITTDPEPVADIGLSARILNKDVKVVAARLFEETQKLRTNRTGYSQRSIQRGIRRIAKDMIA